MFTAVIIRPSAVIFVYPIAIKEKVEPMRSYWGKYKSKGFVSYAGYLKKIYHNNVAAWCYWQNLRM